MYRCFVLTQLIIAYEHEATPFWNLFFIMFKNWRSACAQWLPVTPSLCNLDICRIKDPHVLRGLELVTAVYYAWVDVEIIICIPVQLSKSGIFQVLHFPVPHFQRHNQRETERGLPIRLNIFRSTFTIQITQFRPRSVNSQFDRCRPRHISIVSSSPTPRWFCISKCDDNCQAFAVCRRQEQRVQFYFSARRGTQGRFDDVQLYVWFVLKAIIIAAPAAFLSCIPLTLLSLCFMGK